MLTFYITVYKFLLGWQSICECCLCLCFKSISCTVKCTFFWLALIQEDVQIRNRHALGQVYCWVNSICCCQVHGRCHIGYREKRCQKLPVECWRQALTYAPVSEQEKGQSSSPACGVRSIKPSDPKPSFSIYQLYNPEQSFSNSQYFHFFFGKIGMTRVSVSQVR